MRESDPEMIMISPERGPGGREDTLRFWAGRKVEGRARTTVPVEGAGKIVPARTAVRSLDMPWYRFRFGAEVAGGVPGRRVALWGVLLLAAWALVQTYADSEEIGWRQGEPTEGQEFMTAAAIPTSAGPNLGVLPALGTARLELRTPLRSAAENRPTRVFVKGLMPDQRIEIEFERDGYLSRVETITPGAAPATVELERDPAVTRKPRRAAPTVSVESPPPAPQKPAETTPTTASLDDNPY